MKIQLLFLGSDFNVCETIMINIKFDNQYEAHMYILEANQNGNFFNGIACWYGNIEVNYYDDNGNELFYYSKIKSKNASKKI